MISIIILTVIISAANSRNLIDNNLDVIQDIEVIEGEQSHSVDIPCDLIIEQGRGVLIWKQGRRILFAGSMRVRQDSRMSLIAGGQTSINPAGSVLRISNLNPVDSGEYSCQIELPSGELLVSRKSLVVLQPPTAKISPGGGAITVKTGTSVVLTCSGSGVPVPEITWTKDGKVLGTGKGQADLPLQEVQWQAGGLYQCHANNGVGDQEHIKNFTVNVLHAPVVEVLPAEVEMNPGAPQECRVQIQCLVYSAPASRIQWFHNNRLMTTAEPGVTMWSAEYLHVLQLEDCVSRSGEYTCVAENSLGVNQGTTSLPQHRLVVQEVVVRVDRQIQANSSNYHISSITSLLLALIMLNLI